jgi:hypothetical protein
MEQSVFQHQFRLGVDQVQGWVEGEGMVTRLSPLPKRRCDGFPEGIDTWLGEVNEREVHSLPFGRKLETVSPLQNELIDHNLEMGALFGQNTDPLIDACSISNPNLLWLKWFPK